MLAALAVLEITVLTMSPGADLFARFGHTAVRVEDEAGIRVFNFGAFKPDVPDFKSQFVHAAIPYYLTMNAPELFAYKYRDRLVTGQVLALDEPEARRAIARLEWLAQPENRYYQYDWFRNNCTTRARDLIDEVLDGAWRTQLAGRPALHHGSIRALLLDALWTVPSVGTLFSLTLNARVDEPLDAWQELAMPADLMRGLREARRADGRPLVASEWTWDGPSPHARRQPRWLQPLGEALLLYVLSLGVFLRGRAARIAGGIGLVAWGALSTLVGLYLAAWPFTAYRDTQWTINLLAWSPLAAPLIIAGVQRARGRRPSPIARRVVAIIALSTLAELLLHLFGAARQVHARYAVYALAALALCWLNLLRAEAAALRVPRSV